MSDETTGIARLVNESTGSKFPTAMSSYAEPGPYVTQLSPAEEAAFRAWVKTSRIPFDPAQSNADYDMRGFWKAMQSGDPRAQRSDTNMHFPDVWKTPYHKSFSNESIYALPNAPRWVGDKLINENGRVLVDETPK